MNFVKIVEGLAGAEGPVFDKHGCFYMVAPEVEENSQAAGQILHISLDKRIPEILCSPNIDGNGGIPAGCQCDKDDGLWVADMRLGILHVKPNGEYKQICVKDKDDNTMQGCNDCTFDYEGNLWVTAPAGEIAPSPYRRSMEDAFGSVYCYTKNREVVKVDSGLKFPNGIAVLHTDEGRPEKLIVAETPTKSLWAYDITGPGQIASKKLWGQLPGSLEGGPDGMDFDEENNLLVAHWGSSHIEVFGPEGGDPKQRIKCPFDRPSNIHFKPGSNQVYITEHDNHALWTVDWERKGKKQYCEI